MAFGKLMQGLAGNFSEQNVDQLSKEYGQYLLEGEVIQSGYTLIRDSILFTNIRIIFTDKLFRYVFKILITSGAAACPFFS